MRKSYIIDDDFDPQSRFENLNRFQPEFWKKKKLEQLSKAEWEILCDGCGKCCLNKLEMKNRVHFTNTHCRFLDCKNCSCKIYAKRFEKMFDCRDVDIKAVREKPRWLPKTCAYWLVDNGKDLPYWHPLKTGRASSVHEAGMSLQDRDIVSEVGIYDYDNYIVDWEDL